MQLGNKYENILKNMCWNDAYLIRCLEDQYMENWHNNTTQIYGVAMHVGMVDKHTLSPITGQMLLHIYDTHAESQIFSS